MNEQRRDERGAIAVRPSVIPPGSVVDNGSGSDDDDASPALPCPDREQPMPPEEGGSSGFSRITGPLPTTTTTTPKAALSCTRARSPARSRSASYLRSLALIIIPPPPPLPLAALVATPLA